MLVLAILILDIKGIRTIYAKDLMSNFELIAIYFL